MVEREAGFARRRGKAFFGFKAHLAVDEGSGLVRRAILTPANVNESVVADALPLGDEAAIYADKGYDSAARHAHLAKRGIFDGIMRRAFVGRPLTPEETARNHALVPIRCAIERVFGTLKAQLRLGPGPLPRARPQRRPPRPALPRPQSAEARRPDPVTNGQGVTEIAPRGTRSGLPEHRTPAATHAPPQRQPIRTPPEPFRRSLSEGRTGRRGGVRAEPLPEIRVDMLGLPAPPERIRPDPIERDAGPRWRHPPRRPAPRDLHVRAVAADQPGAAGQE